MSDYSSLIETYSEIAQERIPNLFRLYLNPFVVQTCFCLNAYVRRTWEGTAASKTDYQTFLANSFDEALSGAIKLARYCANLEGRAPTGLVLDPRGRLRSFASGAVGSERIEFIPGLTVVDADALDGEPKTYGFVIIAGPPRDREELRRAVRKALFQIVCVSRTELMTGDWLSWVVPDIVVFDDSFTNHEVPFGAFSARKLLYRHWTRRGKSTFHSTTFQPNTVASLHFLKCLQKADAEFYKSLAEPLEGIRQDAAYRRSLLGQLYSPFLARAIRVLGFETPHVTAAGHYVHIDGRSVFDGVAGVACSIRGHNPENFVEEIRGLDELPDAHAALEARLKELTDLGRMLPAVSGASAVENALKLGLVAQFPRKYVLAFKGGFGGKTLFALTGTARASYKEHLDPLYPHVLYIDAFGRNVLAELESVFESYPIAVVQLELIQAVGGVRPLPPPVLTYLDAQKDQRGYLLFIDEVQTGMYRTGPFLHSQKRGLRPDLLTIGKGTSDMMFPFAVTLYSAAIAEKVRQVHPRLTEELRRRCDYEWGYRTALNVLKQAEVLRLPEQVAASSSLFSELLSEGLRTCKAVRDVRVHGLLIGIELATGHGPRTWIRRRASWLYLLHFLRHESFPLFVGFCQYEPHVLKLTPPLSITPGEVRQVCDTLASVLRIPFYKLLLPAIGALTSASFKRRGRSLSREETTHEPVAR
jgi:acetylornithine/succinyldiaminopimelate/putrescine aminotransferase